MLDKCTLWQAGNDSAYRTTPGPVVLEKFGQMLDTTGIRGQLLAVTDRRGIQHKRGPSRWQQRRYQMKLNKNDKEQKNNSAGVAKWMQQLLLHEQAAFDFDFGVSMQAGAPPVAEAGAPDAVALQPGRYVADRARVALILHAQEPQSRVLPW